MYLWPQNRFENVRSQGDFRVSSYTGLVTAVAGAGALVCFRWASTVLDCIVWWAKWNWYLTTGFTAGQIVDQALFFNRGWSTSPSGSTDIRPAALQNKRKTSHANSLLTAFQIATTGAVTTGTVGAKDSLPLMTRGIWAPTTTLVQLPDVGIPYDLVPYFAYLTANEGLELDVVTAMGAAGVMKLNFEIGWSEILPGSLMIPDNLAS